MTDPATLLALADRCEQAAGPDRELDFAIFRAADPDFHGWHRWALREAALYRDGWQEGCGRKKLGPILLRDRKGYAVSLYNRYAEDKTPRYTASLDKAVTLVPEGWKWKAILRDSARGENTGEGYVHNGRLHMSGQYQGADTFAATPALALCAAALRAWAAMG